MSKIQVKYAVKGNKRLQQTFEAIRTKHIIVAQNHLCCSSCACADLEERAKQMTVNGLVVLGVIYFHNQDFTLARDTGELYLGFSGYDDFDTLKIGELTIQELNKNGLKYTWDNTDHTRILVHLENE